MHTDHRGQQLPTHKNTPRLAALMAKLGTEDSEGVLADYRNAKAETTSGNLVNWEKSRKAGNHPYYEASYNEAKEYVSDVGPAIGEAFKLRHS